MSELAKIDSNLNFCRVFEIPNEYPEGYCFGGGTPVIFNMVDWFNPIPSPMMLPDDVKVSTWQECEAALKEALSHKAYLRPGFRYVLITDFNEAFVFSLADSPPETEEQP